MVFWEPGLAVECVLCGNVRGGGDPPGPWRRNYSTARRRVPIWSGVGTALGYLEYFHP
jgi:hypothetical protein